MAESLVPCLGTCRSCEVDVRKGSEAEGSEGDSKQEESWHRKQRCPWHGRGRTKAPMQDGEFRQCHRHHQPGAVTSLCRVTVGGADCARLWAGWGWWFLTVGVCVWGIRCALKFYRYQICDCSIKEAVLQPVRLLCLRSSARWPPARALGHSTLCSGAPHIASTNWGGCTQPYWLSIWRDREEIRWHF